MGSPPVQSSSAATKTSGGSGLSNVLLPILARIPSTQPFKERMLDKIRSEEASMEKLLKYIVVPQSSIPQEVLKSTFVTPHARMEFWKDEISDWMVVPVVVLLVTGSLAGPTVAGRFFQRPALAGHFLHVPPTAWFGAGAYLGTIVSIVVLIYCLVTSSEVFEDLAESHLTPRASAVFNGSLPALYVFGLVVLTYYMRSRSHVSAALTSLLTIITVGTCTFLAILILLLVGLRWVRSMVKQQRNLSHPEVRLFECLVDMLPFYDFKFQDLSYTHSLLATLEQIASLLEGPFARRFQSDDPVTDVWIQQEMKERAAAVREMKRIVVFSKGHLPAVLVQRATDMFVHICNLDWESLDKAPTKDPTKLERARQLRQRVVRALGVSAVPLVLLLLVIFVKPIRDLDSSHALFAGAILFLAISVLSALDPDFARTGIDLLTKITGKGKGSE